MRADFSLPETDLGNALGHQWVLRANLRNRGTTEFRHVRMKIGDNHPKNLEIRTLRQIQGNTATSLFCITAPFALQNINYVVCERRGATEHFSIQLFLPYVSGTLREIPSSRRAEGHLGSDFSYEDLKVWLYEEDHAFEKPEERPEGIYLRGRCFQRHNLVGHRNGSLALWLDPATAFVKGIDYFSEHNELIREFRAEDITNVENVLIPTRMKVRNVSKKHSTSIELVRAWYDKPIDPEVFEPAFRRRTQEYLCTL